MSNPIGYFETSYFGMGFFGVVQDAIPLSGTIVNQAIENALLQTVENVQQIGTTVTIGGVDVSELIESIVIRTNERNITASCSVVLIGAIPSSVVAESEIIVTAQFTLEGGSVFTNDLFVGVLRLIQEQTGNKSSSVSITAYDSAEEALSEAPTNTTWTGTNISLVQSELTAAGFIAQDLDFDSFSMTSVSLAGFSTVRDLILAAAGAVDEVAAFVQPNGVFCVRSVTAFRDSGLEIPRTGYTSLQQTSSINSKYKTVTVQGLTGLTGTATGTGLSTEEINSSFLTSATDCGTKAQAIVDRAEFDQRLAQVPLNPLLRVGDIVSIVDDSETSISCRVTGVTHTIQWSTPDSSPGAWSSISLEDVAA